MTHIRDNIGATYLKMVVMMYTLLSCIFLPTGESIILSKFIMFGSENDQLYNCMIALGTHITKTLCSLVKNILVFQRLYIEMLIAVLLIEIGQINNMFKSTITHSPKSKNESIIVLQGLYIVMLITILLIELGRVNNIFNSITAHNPKSKNEDIIVIQMLYVGMLTAILLIELGRVNNMFNSPTVHNANSKEEDISILQVLYIIMLTAILLIELGRINNNLNAISDYSIIMSKMERLIAHVIYFIDALPISIIESGRLIEIVNSHDIIRNQICQLNSLITYISVVKPNIIVTLSSIINSGRLLQLINYVVTPIINLIAIIGSIIYLILLTIPITQLPNSKVQKNRLIEEINFDSVLIVKFGISVKLIIYLMVVSVRSIVTSSSKDLLSQLTDKLKCYCTYSLMFNIRKYSIPHIPNYINRLYLVGQIASIFQYIDISIVYHNMLHDEFVEFIVHMQYAFIFRRSWSCRDLQSKAAEATYQARERAVRDEDLLLVPHIDGIHGTANPNQAGKFPVDKATVANRIAGYRHHKLFKTDKGHPDTRHMTAFLKKVPDPSALYDPGLVNFNELVPCKAPVIEYLKVHADMEGTWDYPPRHEINTWRLNRGVSPAWFQGTNITEYVIGSDDNFDDFQELFWQNYNADQELLPTGVLSLDVEDKQIWRFDLIRICKLRGETIVLRHDQEEPDDFPTDLYTGELEPNKKVNVPAKIMFGGTHWGMMISLGITCSTGDVYSYDCQGFPGFVIDFLESLPPIVGAGIKHDVKGVEDFIELVTGRPMRFKAYMELGVLATMCGWQLNRRGMFILSLITIGSTMNKLVSCADGQWGIPFHELDPAMQCYAIGDTKMGHITYGVLISAFLNQIAPDPDMACRLSKCSQIEWVTWFCTLIRESLVGLEICQQAAESSAALQGTYKELVNIIRYRDIHGHVSATPPDSVVFIAGLVRWPSITRGGPRYLHAVRLHHVSVYNAIKESTGLPGTKVYFSRDVEVSDRMYATFGHKDILSLDLSKKMEDPELADYEFALVVHPDIVKPVLSMEFPLDIHYIHSCSVNLDRGVREAMLEWFRLDVSRIEKFFQDCNDNRDLAIDFRGRHEDIRLMFFALMNREPLAVRETEDSITSEVRLAIGRLRAFKAELLTAIQRQDDILHELYLADSDVIYQDRYAWKRLPLPQVVANRKSILTDSMGNVIGCTSAPVPDSSSVDGYPVGRPLAQRLKEFDVVEPCIGLLPVLSMRMHDQCCDGGRYTGKGKRKKKSTWPSGETQRRVMTQDEVEEEVRVVRHVGDEFDFDKYCNEFADYLSELPPTPEIAMVMDD